MIQFVLSIVDHDTNAEHELNAILLSKASYPMTAEQSHTSSMLVTGYNNEKHVSNSAGDKTGCSPYMAPSLFMQNSFSTKLPPSLPVGMVRKPVILLELSFVS
jgi:hypothetical protein